jgi:dihydroflavonol-4-reductase
MQKIFVTGANGHIGCNTVRELLSSGYSVKALVRKTSDLRGLRGLDLEICYGDVQDRQSLIDGSRGCHCIVHLAAVYQYFAKSAREIMLPAVEGTRNIFEAALQNGIQRIIYTSSSATVGYTADPAVKRTVRDWIPDSIRDAYSLAKRDSEKIAWDLSEKFGIPMIALLPGGVLGRYDYRITPSNRLIVDMLKGLGLTIETQLALVDARDVARVHAQAVEQGKPGSRYFVLSNPVDLKYLGKVVQDMIGRYILHLPTPRSMNIMTGSIMEFVGRLTGWTPPMTKDLAEYLSHRYANYDFSETVADFNFMPTPLEDTLRDTINWFLFLGIGRVHSQKTGQFIPEPDWIK